MVKFNSILKILTLSFMLGSLFYMTWIAYQASTNPEFSIKLFFNKIGEGWIELFGGFIFSVFGIVVLYNIVIEESKKEAFINETH